MYFARSGRYVIEHNCNVNPTHQYKGMSLLSWHDHRCKKRPAAAGVSLQHPEASALRSAAGTSCWCWFCSRRCSRDQRGLPDCCWSTRFVPVPQAVTLQFDTHTGGSGTQAALTVTPPVPSQYHHIQSAVADGPSPRSSWQTGWGRGCQSRSYWRSHPRQRSASWNAALKWWGHWPEIKRNNAMLKSYKI